MARTHTWLQLLDKDAVVHLSLPETMVGTAVRNPYLCLAPPLLALENHFLCRKKTGREGAGAELAVLAPFSLTISFFKIFFSHFELHVLHIPFAF